MKLSDAARDLGGKANYGYYFKLLRETMEANKCDLKTALKILKKKS
jgi:hypothetical protein